MLDIGAHIDYYALIAAKLVGKKGRVYAFEPDPFNFSLLKKNVKKNKYSNVVLVDAAVSDKQGKIKLFLSAENKGDHRVYDSSDNRKFHIVNAINLDNYFKKYTGRIDVIKMDIQGGEEKALEGMKGVIQKNPTVTLITEF